MTREYQKKLLHLLHWARESVRDKRLYQLLFQVVVDLVAMRKIDTVDLHEDVQEELLNLSGYYHYSPKKKTNADFQHSARAQVI